MMPDIAALLAWIDSLGATGLDGRDLSELGLKNGNLTLFDQRNGKQWEFLDINLSLTRPSSGGVALTMSSEAGERPWLLRATVSHGEGGIRKVEIETERLSAKDLLLALRIGDGQLEPNIPVSARVRAQIGPDGIPRMIEGRIQLDKGYIVDADEPLSRIDIDRADFDLQWDATRQALVVPFQILSGGTRITLLAQLTPPRESSPGWVLKISGGTAVLASSPRDPDALVLNRIQVGLRIDPDKQRIDVEQGEIGNTDLGLAISGGLDYSSGEPRLAIGIAGTRMSVAAMKRLWPSFISPKVHAWVAENILSGTVERIVIATNAPMATLKTIGPPIPEDGLAIEVSGNGAEIRPVHGLPAIKDADVRLRITGRTASVTVGRGNIDVSAGRRLTISSGLFEVPDHYMDAPASRVRFRIDGSVAAAAELLSSERLRDYAGSPIDPGTSRGNLTAYVTMSMPLKPDLPAGSAQYAMNLEVNNFSAERLVMGQKVEAAALRVRADNQGYVLRGDVKINGIPALLEYRKVRDQSDAEVRVAATLDEAGRARLGFDLGGFVSGPVPIKINGRVPLEGGDSRYSVDADLTQSRIDRLLPGWVKPAGRQARMTFIMTSRPQYMRLDDLSIEGPGLLVKGSVECDGSGDITGANLTQFNLSDGDKATLRAERGPDGALRVSLRGDVYDGRGFIKSSMSGPAPGQAKGAKLKDFDLDVRLGTVAGFHGETLRNVDLKMSRRNGSIMSFSLAARLGRDTPLIGDLRGRAGGRNVMYVETKDAGALFRFSDTYPKIYGGEMWMAMDPPTAANTPQDGILNIRDFTIRGEATLDRVASGAADVVPGSPQAANSGGVEFSRMRVEFTRTHGRFAIKEGVVRGPMIGANDGRLYRLPARRGPHARHVRAVLRAQQHVRADPGVRAVPRRRQQRRPRRPDLRGGRPAGRAGAARQPDLGGDAGIVPEVHGISDRAHAGRSAALVVSLRMILSENRFPLFGISGSLHRLQQHVALFSERQLDHAFRRQLRLRQRHFLVGHGNVVDPDAAALDLTAGVAVGGDEAGLHEGGEHAQSARQLGLRNLDGRQRLRQRAFLEGAARGFRGFIGGGAPMHEGGHLRRQDLLGLVDLLALQRREPCRSRPAAAP